MKLTSSIFQATEYTIFLNINRKLIRFQFYGDRYGHINLTLTDFSNPFYPIWFTCSQKRLIIWLSNL